MKKNIICYILVFIIVLYTSASTVVFAETTETVSKKESIKYEVNAPQMSEDDIINYYKENNLFISSPTLEVNQRVTNVKTYLESRFKNTTWTVNSSDKIYVSDTYRGNPDDLYEFDSYMQSAKAAAGISYTYIGCGAIALCSQLFYLAESAGYTFLNRQVVNYTIPTTTTLDIQSNREYIATEALSKSKGFAAEDWGLDPHKGTFILPHKIISAANSVLSKYYSEQIEVYGDILPSIASYETKINNIMNSIDKGMPVIIFTTSSAGSAFGQHYFNIYGYENWTGVDQNNNVQTHLMFKVNLNLKNNNSQCYMDSEVLKALDCGFIYFNEKYDREFYRPSDYNIPLAYNNSEATTTVQSATITRLRTGYVNHYDSSNTILDAKYLSLSAKKTGAGTAYMNYSYNRDIRSVNIELSWWGPNEGIYQTNGTVHVRYIDSNGNLMLAKDVLSLNPSLSTDLLHPTKIQISLPNNVREFRIFVSTDTPTGSSNKGRLIVGTIDVIFS